MFRLDGKVAIVTGGGSGIGESIARLFATQRARVAILDTNVAAAQSTHDRIVAGGAEAMVASCDISDARQVDDAFAGVERRFGRLDILVNNAGIAAIGNVENTNEEDFDRTMRVNAKGTYLCSRAGVRLMLKGGGGVILNLASIASLIGIEERFAYSASKGAVLTMTRSIALDYMAKNIRCNCICPARVHTPFVDGYLKANYPGREAEMFRKLSEYQPMGRMARPEEVAALALYLCSSEAAFITGQAFPIDGGVLAR